MTATRQEQFLMKRLTRTRKLFAFLRIHRHELFDKDFQEELESMYRDTGAWKEPVPPSLLEPFGGTASTSSIGGALKRTGIREKKTFTPIEQIREAVQERCFAFSAIVAA